MNGHVDPPDAERLSKLLGDAQASLQTANTSLQIPGHQTIGTSAALTQATQAPPAPRTSPPDAGTQYQ